MSQMPEIVLTIVQEETEANLNNISEATGKAEERIRALPEFNGQIVNSLITDQVRELVYRARHDLATETKRQAGYYGGPAKINRASPSVNGVYHRAYLNYCIGGKTLGDILGKELEAIIVGEKERSNGHLFNSELAAWCKAQGVGDEQRVRDKISEKKIKGFFERRKRVLAETE